MKIAVRDDDLGAVAGNALDPIAPPARGLDGGLDRLGARVHGQRRIEPAQAGELGKEGSQAVAVIGARRDGQALGLGFKCRQDAGMGVAVADGGVCAHHVDVAPSRRVPQEGALPAAEHDGQRIVIASAVTLLDVSVIHGRTQAPVATSRYCTRRRIRLWRKRPRDTAEMVVAPRRHDRNGRANVSTWAVRLNPKGACSRAIRDSR